jgi:hypothetical protein
MGLVLLLRGDDLAELTATGAVIRPRLVPARPTGASPPTHCILPNAASSGNSTSPMPHLRLSHPGRNIAMVENRMKAERLPERAPAILGRPEPEIVQQPSARLYGRQQDGGR